MAECNVTVELRGDRRRLRRVAASVLRSQSPRTRFPPLRLVHCFFEGTVMNKLRTGWSILEPFGGFFYFIRLNFWLIFWASVQRLGLEIL